MAEDEGFEPPQTESESGVLPLHKSSMRRSYYIHFFGNVKHIFPIFRKNIPRDCSRGNHFYLTGFQMVRVL